MTHMTRMKSGGLSGFNVLTIVIEFLRIQNSFPFVTNSSVNPNTVEQNLFQFIKEGQKPTQNTH